MGIISISDFLDKGGNVIRGEHAYDKNGVYLGNIKSFNNYSTMLTNGRGGTNDYIHIKVKSETCKHPDLP